MFLHKCPWAALWSLLVRLASPQTLPMVTTQRAVGAVHSDARGLLDATVVLTRKCNMWVGMAMCIVLDWIIHGDAVRGGQMQPRGCQTQRRRHCVPGCLWPRGPFVFSADGPPVSILYEACLCHLAVRSAVHEQPKQPSHCLSGDPILEPASSQNSGRISSLTHLWDIPSWLCLPHHACRRHT